MTPQLAIKSLVRVLAVIFGFSFFVNLLSMTLPLYTMQVFERVLGARSQDTLWALTVVAIFLIGAYGILDLVRSRVMIGIDRWLEVSLYPVIMRTRFMRAAEGRADAKKGGLSDLRNLRAFFSGQAVLAVMDTIWSPLFLLVGFLIHPVLGLIGTAGAVGLIGLSVANEFTMREPQKNANQLLARTAEQTEAAARSAEVVAALGMAPAVLARIEATAEEASQQGRAASLRSTTLSGITKVFRYLVQIAVMGTGIWLVLNDHMTAGAVFAASMILGRGLAPFEQMQRTWTTVVTARQSYRQLQEYLKEKGPQHSTLSYPRPKGALSVEALTFVPRGGQRALLQNVTFALTPGETLGIIGPSAAGKSTLARLLVGVLRPNAGKVRLDGIDVSMWDPTDLGPHIGYVPQDVELLTGTVRENIARFSEATDAEVIAAAQAANAHDLIARLPQGYDTDVGENGVLLSGGQRQRIALARALFRDPAYIVLDEPNSNLDSEGEAAMLAALRAAKARGATILIVAHRPSVLGFVDKLLLLKEGRVEAFGPRQAVMAHLQPRPTVVPPAAQAAQEKAAGDAAR
ncbi:type I secretion system permease/ATPase [Microvirga sp. GCM10011540]|uniref:type I secretion system permease/ATPase n=1 Tax=Microvirga sp. GCM10011540 TaxID=3317338 RepID=UPI003621B70B